MCTEPIVIVGGGLAGLAAAHHLGHGSLLLEREAQLGGLCRTTVRQGFHFDCTGHWLHLADPAERALVDRLCGDQLVTVRRRAEIHLRGVRVPYPFQAHTHGLPTDVVADCLLGYFRAREAALTGQQRAPQTFADYIEQTLGAGIARHFMVPYNTKLWTVPPAEMVHTWCRRFVPIPEPEEVVLGALRPGGANAALGYNASFLYPQRGGIQTVVQALTRALHGAVECDAEVERVDWKRRRLRLRGGAERSYRVLINTMPLSDLVERLVEAPEAVRQAGQALRAASVTYWDLGLGRANAPTDAHWTYFPEPELPFYRVGSASAAAPSLVPEGSRSYYVEVSHPRGTPAPVADAAILDALRRVGLLAVGEEPVVMAKTTIDCAYVIMDAAYGPARALLLEWLRAEGILSTGRYGGWTYDSMEGALQDGRRAAALAGELR
jgi:protoporphyrinogen oxidase